MPLLASGQTSRMQSKSLRTEIRNLKIQVGEGVDVLQMPGPEMNFFRIEILFTSCEPELQASRKNDDDRSLNIII